MEIIDNFLPEHMFSNIHNLIVNEQFPWFFVDGIANKHDKSDSYFVHTFYQYNQPNSPFYEPLSELVKFLDAKSMIRMRAIRYIGKETLIEHATHIDFDFPHKSMVLYLNDNDGFTRIEDKETVQSVRNRALLHDGGIQHNSTNCTNKDYRLVLTVNYF